MANTGIGIVFNIDALGGGFYGAKAWRIIMKQLQASYLSGCTIKEGDTDDTLNGKSREYCIAFFKPGLNIDQIRSIFAELDEVGLASKSRRFIQSPRLDSEPLVITGSIDSRGHFVEDEWTRVFHDLCKEAGWGYKPTNIPDDLSSELRNELKQLMGHSISSVDSKPKKWYQFWK
jgi:hypothetical protein